MMGIFIGTDSIAFEGSSLFFLPTSSEGIRELMVASETILNS